jgi:PIN domain nuclease of toxin-antitoxin system
VRLLLDTHVLIWSVTDPERLREELRHAIVDPDNDVYVSIVSCGRSLSRRVSAS